MVEISAFQRYSAKRGLVTPYTDFTTGETRWVELFSFNLWTPNARLPHKCRLRTQKNYVGPRHNINRGTMVRYYVKKRRAIRTQGDDLFSYQFIASRIPLVRPLNEDANQLEDPLDLPRPGSKDNPNRFRSELGVIYCERATMKGLRFLESNPAPTGCGILETLVTLCLQDISSVSPELVETLNLDEEFDEDYVQDVDEAASASYIKERIRDMCDHLVKIDRTGETEEQLKRYLRGAEIAQFEHVIAKESSCQDQGLPNTWEWMIYETTDLLNTDQEFDDVFRDTGRFWYVCSEKDYDTTNFQIIPL